MALRWIGVALLASLCFSVASPIANVGRPAYPVAIWHGLGDRYDSPGLASLADDIHALHGDNTFVYMIRTNNDSSADSKESLFGNMDSMLTRVANQLKDTPELANGFDAIGLSQGGVFLRAYVECYNLEDGYPKVRNLITMGSPHLGISSAPPCSPTDIFCKATQWALRAGAWTPYAQSSIVPAQYFRNQDHIDDYLAHSTFLKDINNERVNDTQPVSGASHSGTGASHNPDEPRNATYKKALTSLNNFVTFAFSNDMTVIPWTSPLFTLPHADNPAAPLAYTDLPLYSQDYIGLRELDENDAFHQRTCKGQHMEIGRKCWLEVMSWLGKNGQGRGSRSQAETANQHLFFNVQHS